MKLTLVILCSLVSALAMAAKTAKPTILAAIKIESENTHYKLLNSQSGSDAILERISSKLSNKTIRIPKGLAADIKGDLLNLQWRTQFKSVRKAASGCEIVASVDVEAEDTVKICRDQLNESSQALNIQKRLNELIESKK